jgi:hypothetical protein
MSLSHWIQNSRLKRQKMAQEKLAKQRVKQRDKHLKQEMQAQATFEAKLAHQQSVRQTREDRAQAIQEKHRSREEARIEKELAKENKKLLKDVKLQRKQIMNRIVNHLQKNPTNIALNFSDFNLFCNETVFRYESYPELQLFLNSPLGEKFDSSEVEFILHLLREDLRKHPTTHIYLKQEKYFGGLDSPEGVRLRQRLVHVYENLPALAKPHIEKWKKHVIEEDSKRQAIERRRLEEEGRIQERRNAIARNQLVDYRIRDLNLPIPRWPKNAQDFEHICRDWLEAWGETSAIVSQQSGDSGIDVYSDHCAAQVKFYSNKPVGRPEIQQLKGATSFAYNGYTPEAREWAESASVCLFSFDVDTARFTSLNLHSSELLRALAIRHIPQDLQ